MIFFSPEHAEVVAEGAMSQMTFQRLFLDRYELSGERHQPGKDASVQGVLLATKNATVVTVPILAWEAEDGGIRLLCQASDDGSPPAFSVFSRSENDLLNQIVGGLRD